MERRTLHCKSYSYCFLQQKFNIAVLLKYFFRLILTYIHLYVTRHLYLVIRSCKDGDGSSVYCLLIQERVLQRKDLVYDSSSPLRNVFLTCNQRSRRRQRTKMPVTETCLASSVHKCLIYAPRSPK